MLHPRSNGYERCSEEFHSGDNSYYRVIDHHRVCMKLTNRQFTRSEIYNLIREVIKYQREVREWAGRPRKI